MGGGGKGGQSQQAQSSTMSIPPEVLARYNAVNARAEEVAQRPFQQYGGEFVAPLTQLQHAGINTINYAGDPIRWGYQRGMPLYDQAASTIGDAYDEGIGGVRAGMGTIGKGIDTYGRALGTLDTSLGTASSAFGAAQPYNAMAQQGIGGALSAAQPYNTRASQGIGAALSGAQPYQDVATGLAGAGTAAVNPGALEIGRYMSPYNDAVVQSTLRQLQQQQRMQQQDLTGDAILNGSWGGDRAGIAKAVLAGQQDMATGTLASNLYNQNYSQALGAAQQQQGVGLGAAQANRAALTGGAGLLANIGQQGYAQGLGAAGAYQGLGQQMYGQGLGAAQAYQGLGQQVYGQGMGLSQQQSNVAGQQAGVAQGLVGAGQAQAGVANTGFNMGLGAANAYQGLGNSWIGAGNAISGATLGVGQAQLGAGTLEQQTNQARDAAYYQQFLQEQGYPFQVTQFLSNIATGTGALSGSTTTGSGYQQVPQPFFSDEKLKEGVSVIGKTKDGIPIVRFRYKDSPHTQIGMLAQDVEKKRPEAVGLAGAYKTVDYDAATRDRHANGGLAAAGGVVANDNWGDGYAPGGIVYDPSMTGMLALHQAMYPGAGGRGTMEGGPRGMKLSSPTRAMLKGPELRPMTVQAAEPTMKSALSTAGDLTKAGQGISDLYKGGREAIVGSPASADGKTPETGGLAGRGGKWDPENGWFGRQLGTSSTSGGIGAANTNAPSTITRQELPPPPDASAASATSLAGLGDVPADSQSVAALLEDPDVVKEALSMFAARGGRMRRAVGGVMPYSEDEGYIPDEIYEPNDPMKLASVQQGMAPKLQPSKEGGGGRSGFGEVLGTAATLAKLGLMFLKDGGRTGYADGGTPDEEADWSNVVPFEPRRGLNPSPDWNAFGKKERDRGDPDAMGATVTPLPKPHERPFTGLRNTPTEPGLNPRLDIDTDATGRYVDPMPPGYQPQAPTGVDPTAARAAVNQVAATVPQTPGHGLNPSRMIETPPGFRQPGGQEIQHDPDSVFGRMIPQESGNRHYRDDGVPVTSPKGATGIAQVMPTTGPEAAKLAGLPWNPDLFNRRQTGDPRLDEEAKAYNLALGKAYYQEQYRTFGDPYVAAAAYNAGPEAVRRAQAMAATKGGNYLQYLPAETQKYVSIVSGGGQGGQGALALNAPAQPALDPGIGGAANIAMPADPQPKGNWFDRNERPIMAGLAFLGNMLASPSRTLIGAVGSGLAAAAPQYLASGFRQQELGQGQERIDITRNAQLIGLANQLRAMVANQIKQDGRADPGTLEQLNRIMGMIGQGTASGVTAPPVGGAPGSPQLPAGGPRLDLTPTAAPPAPITSQPLLPPAGGPPAAAPPPAPATSTEPPSMRMPSVDVNDPDFLRKLDPNFNPQVLLKRASDMAGVDPAQADSLRAEARAAQDRINQTGMGVGPGGEPIPVKGWGEVKAARDRVADNAAWVQQQQPIFQQRQAMRHNIEKIVDTVKDFEPGRLNALWADIQSLAKGAGVPVRNTPTMNAEAYEKFVKEAASVVMGNPTGDQKTDQARELLREGFANPNLQPGAVRSILGQALGYLDYADDYYKDVTEKLPRAAHLNRNLRTVEFDKENPTERYVERRTKDIPVRGDVPDSLAKFKPGYTYILEPGDPKRLGIGTATLPGPTQYRYVGVVDGKPRFERVK